MDVGEEKQQMRSQHGLTRRLCRLAVAFALATACFAAAAHAATAATMSVTATVSGSTISVQTSGTTDSCDADLGCASQTVEIEVDPQHEYDACIEPESPQLSFPVSSASVPFSESGSVTVAPGQTYLVCAYIVDTDSDDISLPDDQAQTNATTAPVSCPTSGDHAITVQAPNQIAVGRTATLSLSRDSVEGSLTDVVLTLQSGDSATPYYTSNLGAGALAQLKRFKPLTYSVPMNRGLKPITVSLSYVKTALVSDNQCIGTQTKTIQPIAGNSPTAALSAQRYRAAINFHAPGACQQTRVEPEIIAVSGDGVHAQIISKDECEKGSWHQHGAIPGIRFAENDTRTNGTGITFTADGTSTRTLKLTVSVGHRVVQRGWLVAHYLHSDPIRVWQGTDEFVNYCIDQNKKVFSLHLRLYCWIGGTTDRWASITKHPGTSADAISGDAVAVAPASLPKLPTELAGAAGLQVRPAEVGITGDGTGYLGGFNGKRAMKLTQHSGSAPFGNISWKSWLAGRASGSGAVWLNNGIPDDAHGTFHRFTASVLAFRPRDGIFTRMRVVWITTGISGNAHIVVYKAEHYRGIDGEPGYWMWS